MLQGGKNVEIDRAVPGDIAAVAKVDEIEFDCVLHDSHDEDHIHMRPLEFPTPMHGLAITPKRRGDEQRISDVLHKMIAEDPTLVVEHDPTVNETVLRGLGELHLRSVLERMASQFKLEVDTRPPRDPVPRDDHREGRRPSPPQEADRRRRAVRRGVPARSSRCRAARGFEFVDQVKGGAIPNTVHARGAERRRAGARHAGASPAFRCRTCASSSTTASTIRSIRRKSRSCPPARKAFLDAIGKARPIVLEPIVSVEIDLSRRHDGRHGRRSVVAARPGHGHATMQAGMFAVNGLAPLVGARRLFGAAEVDDRRPRLVDDAAVALRAGAAEPAATSSRPSTRKHRRHEEE